MFACFFLFAATTSVAQQDRWLHTMQHGNIAYFTAESPAEVVRYDLSSRQFLAPVQLSANPTAFYVDDDFMFIAYGTILVRRDLDGSNEIQLQQFSGAVVSLVTYRNNLYANDTVTPFVNRINKTTGGFIETAFFFDSMGGFSIAPGLLKIFGRSLVASPADIFEFSIDFTGNLQGQGNSPYSGTYPDATLTWVYPGEAWVIDNSGTVYSTDNLDFAGDVGGAFRHVAFLGNETITLRNKLVSRYDTELQFVGEAPTNNEVLFIYMDSGQVVGFYDNGGGLQVENIAVPQAPSQAIDPVG